MDGTRISQVVNNLLENAIIHTPDGGSITVSAGYSGPTGSEMVRVAVADSGPGIQSEDLARVFDRFFRGGPSRARATGGVGLGLTIAKQLVEVHGGTIHVESIIPKGGQVRFRTARHPAI